MSLFVLLALRRHQIRGGGVARSARKGFRLLRDVTLLLRLWHCPRILLLKFCYDSVTFLEIMSRALAVFMLSETPVRIFPSVRHDSFPNAFATDQSIDLTAQ
jgi:hypothetical protein